MAKKTKTTVEETEQLEALFADEPETEDDAVVTEALDETVENTSRPGRPARFDPALRLLYRTAARAKARSLGGTWEKEGDDYKIIPGADHGEPFVYTYEEFQTNYAEKQAAKAAKQTSAAVQEGEDAEEGELVTV